MFSQKYERLNSYIKPNDELIKKVKKLSSEKVLHKNMAIKPYILKPAIAIMVLILTYCSMPVLASTDVYHLMYLISPTVAQYFVPVQKSYEDQGIKIEVVSAYIHDNEAQIYITMQDLMEDRIDETTDLNDSYSINRAFDCTIGYCEKVGFDKETKTATFLITITNNENREIKGEKITFLLNNFMSHKQEWNDIKIPLELEDINNKETRKVQLSGFSTLNDKYRNLANRMEEQVLVPQYNIDFGVTNMQITGIAYIDNKLHIQVSAKDNYKIDNHGEIYLINKETNEKRTSDYNLGFVLGKKDDKYEYSEKYYTHDENRRDFTEYVFDISKDKLKDYSVYGDFFASGTYVEGKWRITFEIQEK